MIVETLTASPAQFIALVFVLGLLVGSFLNVVIHRVPVMPIGVSSFSRRYSSRSMPRCLRAADSIYVAPVL